MNSNLLKTAAVVLALCLGACASSTHPLNPQTGDVSFRLHWQGEADLDLHVEDPHGIKTGIPGLHRSPKEAVAAIKREQELVSQGYVKGILDVDCNATPEALCERPIENIYWPPGSAPSGKYRTWVHLYQPLWQGVEEVSFTLEIRRGKRVVETHQGVLTNDSRTSDSFHFAYGS